MSAPPTTSTETTLRRLAFVKYLFFLAEEQSQKPEPLSSAAVLQCHDSVEFFLDMAVEAHNVRVPSDAKFLDYWDLLGRKIDPVDGDGLAHKEPMRRLNKTRVTLKHHGTLATGLDVRDLCEWTRRFFVDNTPRCFGVDFENVSLADLVVHAQVRADVRRAVEARATGDLDGAFTHAAIALKRLVTDYTSSARDFSMRSPFDFGDSLNFMSSHMLGLRPRFGDRSDAARVEAKLAEYVDKMTKIVAALQEGMKFLSLGLDYRRYARFERLTPHVFMTLGSSEFQTTQWSAPARSGLTRTEADADFCIEFVVETALRLQDVDLTLPTLEAPSVDPLALGGADTTN